MPAYTYAYPRPMVTVDAIVFTRRAGSPHLLLIERGQPPFAGLWALPGGFVDMDETLEHAVARELAEETGLRDVRLEQLHTFGDPGRDPRGRTISVVYCGEVEGGAKTLRAGDDAAQARWFPVDALPELAFDHRRIVDYALKLKYGTGAKSPSGKAEST